MNARLIFLHRSARRGMVLFELIIALTVFTLVAFALVIALNSAFTVATERNQIDAATRGLENQIALLHAAQLVPQDKDLDDDGSGSGILYHLTILSEQAFDQKKQPLLGLYRVTITAKWTSNGQPYERQVSELVYQP
jgi:type II secretory pathway pseudopilin PulG